jgi:hypothetical protein
MLDHAQNTTFTWLQAKVQISLGPILDTLLRDYFS